MNAENYDQDESKIVVVSEEHPDRKLLETIIHKDGYQKQQGELVENMVAYSLLIWFQKPSLYGPYLGAQKWL